MDCKCVDIVDVKNKCMPQDETFINCPEKISTIDFLIGMDEDLYNKAFKNEWVYIGDLYRLNTDELYELRKYFHENNEVVEELEEITRDNLLNELREIKKVLDELGDINDVRIYVKENLNDEVIDLRKRFNDEYSNVDINDEVKKEIVDILDNLGITV